MLFILCLHPSSFGFSVLSFLVLSARFMLFCGRADLYICIYVLFLTSSVLLFMRSCNNNYDDCLEFGTMILFFGVQEAGRMTFVSVDGVP